MGALHSTESRWILCKHCLTRIWRREGGKKGGSLSPSLPTAALNMVHCDWKEMNKDELSVLKNQPESRSSSHSPTYLQPQQRKGSIASLIHLYINIGRIYFFFNLVPLDIGSLCENLVFCGVPITCSAVEALYPMPAGTIRTEHYRLWKCHRYNGGHTSNSTGNTGGVKWQFLDQPSFGSYHLF